MGYPKENVESAMIAAFMNPDRAVQYLEEGIPDMGGADDAEMGDAADGPTPTTWDELVQNARFRAEIAAIRDQAALQAYLQGLQTADPAKLALIQANPQAFAAILNAAQAQAAAAPAPPAGGAALPFGMAAPPEAAAAAACRPACSR